MQPAVGLSVGISFRHLSVDGDRMLDFRSLRTIFIFFTKIISEIYSRPTHTQPICIANFSIAQQDEYIKLSIRKLILINRKQNTKVENFIKQGFLETLHELREKDEGRINQ